MVLNVDAARTMEIKRKMVLSPPDQAIAGGENAMNRSETAVTNVQSEVLLF